MSLIGGVYTLGPEIGKGSFATVYKCFDSRTHRAVAVKSVVRSKLKLKKLIENLEIEITILKSMKHPHIVGLLDYCQTATHFHLVIDYCSMGDLSYFIRRRDQLMKTHPVILSLLDRYPSPEGLHGLNEVLVIHFLKQLASALQFLRSKSLVHRDIKPQNLLLCPPVHSKQEFEDGRYVGLWELPILKIADFGFARFLPSTSMAETLCGLPLYMAPEILRYEKYNAKADLWSVGAVLYEMTVGKPPFRAANHIELLKNIEKTHDRIKFPSSAQVPEPLKALIRSLLKYNPTERVSFLDFFGDALLVNDLKSNDTPLETSEMDENLFISEYISPIKPSDRAALGALSTSPKSTAVTGTKTAQTTTDTFPEPGARLLDRVNIAGHENDAAVSRDEQIKSIIVRNSPDPASSVHSLKAKYSDTKLGATGKNRDDIILERDYVVVEKRAVEVNAIADELARVGTGVFRRRLSGAVGTTGALQTGTGASGTAASGGNAVTGISSERDALISRRNSQRSNSTDSTNAPFLVAEKRVSISISPTNALGKAISLASNRLFGHSGGFGANMATGQGSEQAQIGWTGAAGNAGSGAQNQPNAVSNHVFETNLLLNKWNLPIPASLSETGSQTSTDENADDKILRELESIATKAHAINLFADVKFSQLIPSPPSLDTNDDQLRHTDLLPPKMVKTISEEGVVLYVKTLSLFAKGMKLASDWWSLHYDRDEVSGEQNLVRSMNMHTSLRINELVQWIREKFNECLEKAEFIKLRLQEATLSLERLSGIFSESNIYVGGSTATAASGGAGNAGSGASASNTASGTNGAGNAVNALSPVSGTNATAGVDSGIVAEKLIFDRALEISRNAAVNELVKEDLKGCELSYSTAIWMLEALLDEDGSDDGRLDGEDKVTVEKFIVGIGNRLSVLKRKLELM